MDFSEWSDRLGETFRGPNGLVGEKVCDIIELEVDHKMMVSKKYNNYHLLSDSFFDFYIETLHLSGDWISKHGYPDNVFDYDDLFFKFLISFRNFRAAENCLLVGYPLAGMSLLRNIKDQAIFFGAFGNGYISLHALWGFTKEEHRKRMSQEDMKNYKPMEPGLFYAARDRAKKEEYKAFSLMIRENSGLDEKILSQLSQWEDSFNLELHGARLSYASEKWDWWKLKQAPWVGPKMKERDVSLYMTLSVEVKWLLHKTLPLIQLEPFAFGDTWVKKWEVLDDSFSFFLKNTGNIALAIIGLAEKNFNFSPALSYSEKE